MKDTVDQILNNLNEIGRSWATYGLNAGKAALESSAATLKNTAEYLGTVSQRFAPPVAPAEEPKIEEQPNP